MIAAGGTPSRSPWRQIAWPLALPYAVATALRNLAYDAGLLARHRLEARVVSVGNLTVGGTGKTPLVLWLVEAARRAGRRPGVLARGYRRAAGQELNDEGMLLRARVADLPQVQDSDRVRGGRRLIAEHGVDLVIVDDGFQHRRLRRDFDVLCMDAARPFGEGGLLPSGDLRESRAGLRRADAIVLTRADAIGAGELEQRRERLRAHAGRAIPIFAAVHRPLDVVHEPSGARGGIDALAGRLVHLISAIARPETFEATVRSIGAEVVGHDRFRDHHAFRADELQLASRRARDAGAVLLATEKDAVKLRGIRADAGFAVLRIALEFVGSVPRGTDLGL